MGIKIVTDLDGVLRDLNQCLGNDFGVPYPTTWYWRFEERTIFDFINSDLNILYRSPKTKYFNTIVSALSKPIEIWTNQPEEWRPLTVKWCDKNIKNYNLVFLSPKEKYLKLMDEPNTLLIEDNPKFSDYSRIILIDQPYNQKVEANIRVSSPEELLREITNV